MSEIEQKQNNIIIDDKEYKIEDLSEKARICVQHLADLQSQANAAKMKLDQLNAATSVFMKELKEEVTKEKIDPSKTGTPSSDGFEE